jgi:drug/metabolite transporter (DMT)-like permease
MTNNNSLLHSYALLGVGIIFISFGSIFAKMSNAPSLAIAFYRLFFSALIMLPFFIWHSRKEVKSINKKLWGQIILSGLLLALHFATWISSLKFIKISNAVVLVSLQPIFVAIFSYFLFKEKQSKKQSIAMGLAFAGILMLGQGDFQGGTNSLIGDILAILGAVFAALYWMVGAKIRQHLSVTTYTGLAYSACAFFLSLICLSFKVPFSGYGTQNYFLFFLLALIPTIGGHNLMNLVLPKLSPLVISLSILGEAAGASFLALLIFKEMPTGISLIGNLLTVIGIFSFIKAKHGTEIKNIKSQRA